MHDSPSWHHGVKAEQYVVVGEPHDQLRQHTFFPRCLSGAAVALLSKPHCEQNTWLLNGTMTKAHNLMV